MKKKVNKKAKTVELFTLLLFAAPPVLLSGRSVATSTMVLGRVAAAKSLVHVQGVRADRVWHLQWHWQADLFHLFYTLPHFSGHYPVSMR